MPLIMYKCNLCDNKIEKIVINLAKVKGVVPCQCGGFLERMLRAPTTTSAEQIDAGDMVKPVFFDSKRYELAKEQGDAALKDYKEKERLNEEIAPKKR